MPISQIAQRDVKFESDAEPEFPALATISARLGPPELFGSAPLSGRLDLRIPGQPAPLVGFDMVHGGATTLGGGRLPTRCLESKLLGWPIYLNGRGVTVRAEVRNVGDLERMLTMVADYLPAILSEALESPVELEHMSGTVDGIPFQTVARGEFAITSVGYPPNRNITALLEAINHIPESSQHRLLTVLRYLNQERWLAYMAPRPLVFAPERLLNLAKALEALFGLSGSTAVSALRKELAKLGISERLVEVYAAVIHVRNQVDVGHVRLTSLSESDLSNFHHLLKRGALAISWLVTETTKRLRDGAYDLQPYVPSPANNGTLCKVGAVLNSLDERDHETYLTEKWPQVVPSQERPSVTPDSGGSDIREGPPPFDLERTGLMIHVALKLNQQVRGGNKIIFDTMHEAGWRLSIALDNSDGLFAALQDREGRLLTSSPIAKDVTINRAMYLRVEVAPIMRFVENHPRLSSPILVLSVWVNGKLHAECRADALTVDGIGGVVCSTIGASLEADQHTAMLLRALIVGPGTLDELTRRQIDLQFPLEYGISSADPLE